MRALGLQRNSRQLSSMILLAALSLAAVLFFSACGATQVASPTPSPTLTLTPTFPPTPTPTPLPLGSTENPFVIGLVDETDLPQIQAAAGELARQLAQRSGKVIAGKVYPGYAQLLDDMRQGSVHAAWMPPLTYVYASQEGLAQVALLTNHFGVYQYGSQFMANVSSNFTPYYDPISGLSSADAVTALEQFRGLRPCMVDPLSVSGYVLPAGLLRFHEIETLPAVLAQSHTAVVRALYIRGICDFGASFSISGDPRTASTVQEDLKDVMNRVVIIWRSEANIPNLNLSLNAKLSEADRLLLTNAFLEVSKTPEGKALLGLSAGNYQIEEVKPVSDDLYNPLRDMIKALDLDLQEAIGK